MAVSQDEVKQTAAAALRLSLSGQRLRHIRHFVHPPKVGPRCPRRGAGSIVEHQRTVRALGCQPSSARTESNTLSVLLLSVGPAPSALGPERASFVVTSSHFSSELPVAAPTRAQVEAIFRQKHPEHLGPGPARRQRWGYFTPDDWYEAFVAQLVVPGCRWLDVGCGRFLFPSNPGLAAELAGRAGHLTGVDPSDNIHDNPFVHERFHGFIEDYESDSPYDLVTFRMVVEHITQPDRTLDRLRRLVCPGGRVLIYTVNRRSPVAVVAALTPFAWHGPLVKFFFNTEERDAFPTAYLMNTRRTLRTLFTGAGFQEAHFSYLSDCRAMRRFASLNNMELALWKILDQVGWAYPENCLLGLYQRVE